MLQVLPSLTLGGGGVERGAIDVAVALKAAGGRSVVASAGGGMARELEREGVPHVTLPLDSKNPFVIYRNIRRLQQVIAEHQIDIVHARSRAPAWSAFTAARRSKIHFMTSFHGTYSGSGNFIKKHYNSIMTRGERVIAISEFIGNHIRNVYGVEDERIRVIPRGINLALFNPTKVSAERVVGLAGEWRLSDGIPVILLPGRLTRWKGQAVLIEALARLGRHDIRCLLLGSDQGRESYRDELEQMVKRLDLEDVVHVADHCSDMPAAYMLADVVVSASTDPEAFGRIAAEAQAMGCPVIAADHGGARETVKQGKTGWLVFPGDPDALAQALAQALAMGSAAREKLAASAKAHIQNNFSKDKMCNRTLAVYDEVMGLSGAPGMIDL